MKNKFRSKSFIFIVSSPSGCGKTTLVQALLKDDTNLKRSVSVTTRLKREGEVDSKDYFFISEEKYKQMVKDDLLLERAEVFSYSYGTPKGYVEKILAYGQDVVCVIDWQGAASLAKRTSQSIVSVFILPPSLSALKSRLTGRGTDSEKVINARLSEAKKEISKCSHYDYVVINNKFDDCLAQLKSILKAERAKRIRLDIPGLITSIEKE
jgi:guanylate kinase